jgi:hypothetical protein
MTAFFPGDADMMARTFGVVLGAASCSDDVSDERLDAAARKMKAILAEAADTGRALEAAQDRFSAAMVAGRRAVKRGEIADWAAETALRQIEDDIADADVVLI